MSWIRYRVLFGIVPLLGILLADPGVAACCVESNEELARIDRTKDLVLDRADVTFESPADLSQVMDPCICSLVEFSLTEDGLPTDVQVVRSVPKRILDRFALLALMKSNFRAPEDDELEGHLILFIYCFQE
jgi:TonB family protein